MFSTKPMFQSRAYDCKDLWPLRLFKGGRMGNVVERRFTMVFHRRSKQALGIRNVGHLQELANV